MPGRAQVLQKSGKRLSGLLPPRLFDSAVRGRTAEGRQRIRSDVLCSSPGELRQRVGSRRSNYRVDSIPPDPILEPINGVHLDERQTRLGTAGLTQQGGRG